MQTHLQLTNLKTSRQKLRKSKFLKVKVFFIWMTLFKYLQALQRKWKEINKLIIKNYKGKTGQTSMKKTGLFKISNFSFSKSVINSVLKILQLKNAASQGYILKFLCYKSFLIKSLAHFRMNFNATSADEMGKGEIAQNEKSLLLQQCC